MNKFIFDNGELYKMTKINDYDKIKIYKNYLKSLDIKYENYTIKIPYFKYVITPYNHVYVSYSYEDIIDDRNIHISIKEEYDILVTKLNLLYKSIREYLINTKKINVTTNEIDDDEYEINSIHNSEIEKIILYKLPTIKIPQYGILFLNKYHQKFAIYVNPKNDFYSNILSLEKSYD